MQSRAAFKTTAVKRAFTLFMNPLHPLRQSSIGRRRERRENLLPRLKGSFVSIKKMFSFAMSFDFSAVARSPPPDNPFCFLSLRSNFSLQQIDGK